VARQGRREKEGRGEKRREGGEMGRRGKDRTEQKRGEEQIA
jgi:hypothetical protein